MHKAIGAAALIACLAPMGARAQAVGRINIYEASSDSDPEMIRRAIPAGGPREWGLPTDYPAAALAENREGELFVDVSVSADDRVTGCRVVPPGAHLDMDSATCAIMRTRGKFRHALAADGSAQPGIARLQVYFYIAATGYGPAPMATTPMLPPPGSVRAAPIDSAQLQLHDLPAGATNLRPSAMLDISPKGSVSRCRISESSGTDPVDTAICRQLGQAKFLPALDRSRVPVAQKDYFVRLVIAQ